SRARDQRPLHLHPLAFRTSRGISYRMDFSTLPLTLRQLQYAVAVAEYRSFRRASEACFVSQPSLSAQVAELESSLGVRLFERERGGVLLTPAGEAIVARARQTLLAAQELAQE